MPKLLYNSLRKAGKMKINTIKIMLMILFILTSGLLYSDNTKIRYFQVEDCYSYQIRLLNLALDKTRIEYGDAEAVPVNTKITEERGFQLLQKGKTVDVAFAGATKEREETLKGVRFPIMQGLFGYRVFMIKKDKEPEFKAVNIIQELQKKERAGILKQWDNSEILENNKLAFDNSAPAEEILYKQLDAGKIDYIPIQLCDAWNELDNISKKYPDFTIDSKSGFYYPYPVYFYVNKENTVLSERIEKGLNELYIDGSLRELFLKHFSSLIEKAEPGRRNYFILENPKLPPFAAIPETSWWFNNKLQSY